MTKVLLRSIEVKVKKTDKMSVFLSNVCSWFLIVSWACLRRGLLMVYGCLPVFACEALNKPMKIPSTLICFMANSAA